MSLQNSASCALRQEVLYGSHCEDVGLYNLVCYKEDSGIGCCYNNFNIYIYIYNNFTFLVLTLYVFNLNGQEVPIT